MLWQNRDKFMSQTQMEKEALQAPDVLRNQFAQNEKILTILAERLKNIKPPLAMTIARGSSDHAATFAKYLLETKLGIVTSSAAPSVLTLYRKNLQLKNCLVIGISQSGASPDVGEMLTTARQQGAITVAVVNQVESPLAQAAEFVVPLLAGPEKAVAATKTYLATLGTLIQLTAFLSNDEKLKEAMTQLPHALEQAAQMDWSAAVNEYQSRHNTYVIGRGYGFPVTQEAALKFKETARIHAEAFSAAEVLHGPFALVEKNFPILIMGQQDETLPGLLEMASRMKKLDADVLLALPGSQKLKLSETATIVLPQVEALHPICDPLLNIQAFYMMVAKLSVARGLNPDAPENLSKVTRTW
jgi:glucosamine--fructose-6-phosphate aminotransferase (isomerizing)